MKSTTVYIKIEQCVEVSNKKVYIEDIAKIYAADSKLQNDLNRQVLKVIQENKECKYCYSVMKVIEILSKAHPEIEIVNLGETDFILDYRPPKKSMKVLEYIKTGFVGLIIFFGGFFSIMTFNEDSSVKEIFRKIYELVTGQARDGWSIIEIGYCLGITIGILIFYNHFTKKKVSSDPTPIQIEMRKYETDVNTAMLQNASREGKTIDSN